MTDPIDFNRQTAPHPGFKGGANPGPHNPLVAPVDTSIPMHVHPNALNIEQIVKPLTLSDGQTRDGLLLSAQAAHKALYETWGKLHTLRQEAGGDTITTGLEQEYINAVTRLSRPADSAFVALGNTLRSAIEAQQALINNELVDKRSRPELQAEIRAMIRAATKVGSPAVSRNMHAFSRIQAMGLPGVAAALAVEHVPQLAGIDSDSMAVLRKWGEEQFAAPLLNRRKALEIILDNHGESLAKFRAFVGKQMAIKISAQTRAVKKLREIV